MHLAPYTRALFLLTLLALGLGGCGGGSGDTDDEVIPTIPHIRIAQVRAFDLGIAKPSGLAINATGTTLYVVSEQTGQLYSIQSDGSFLQPASWTGGNAPEGVHFDRTDGSYWIANEGSSELVHVESAGFSELSRTPIQTSGASGSGLGGVVRIPDNTFVLVETRDPTPSAIRLNIARQEIGRGEVNQGQAEDYTGVCWDLTRGLLWFVSAASSKVWAWNPSTGQVVGEAALGLPQPEGIAVSPDGTTLYIVDDATGQCYVYSLP